MPKRATKRIGLRDVEALDQNSEIWDASVIGFGARRRSGTAVSFVLMYRNSDGRQRWLTIGKLGSPWTVETARDEAKRLLGDVAYGLDPAADRRAKRDAMTVGELCDQYLADGEAGRLIGRRGEPKKASTVSIDRGMVAAHIKPLLGGRSVASISRRDVESFMHDIASGKTARTAKGKPRGVSRIIGGRGAATRTVGLLGSIFSFAINRGLIEASPVRGARRFADGQRERRLNDAEYVALAKGLKAAQEAGVWPPAIAALKFLTLTGWRSSEALSLRWRDVDLVRRVATLRDTKSGRSSRPLSRAALDVTHEMRDDQTGQNDPNGLVFRSSRSAGPMAFKKIARSIFTLAELTGVSPHTLRHSYASVAVDLGLSELTIASLLGHRKASVTSKYAPHADATLLQAADQVARGVSELMGETKPAATVVELRAAPRA
jgi:integrase